MTAVTLTFDDGPWPGGTDRLIDLLAQHGAHATFFIWGEAATQHPELVRALVAAGHSVQPHCWRHVRQDEISPEEVESDLDAVLALLRELDVPEPSFWRPPYGVCRNTSAQLAQDRGLELAGWHIDPEDYFGTSATAMFDVVSAGVLDPEGTGSVILMHDNPTEALQWARRQNVDATIELVRMLLAQFECGPLDAAVPEHLLWYP